MRLAAQSSTIHLFRLSSRRLTTPLKAIPTRNPFSTGASTPPEKHFGIDPYNYTDGRWLRDERLNLERRYINFDFGALCQKILSLCNAKDITSCEKIDGGSSRVLIFTLEDGRRTVAKLPFKIAGPVSLTTASEVATIRYLQQKTSIPIPRILDWSADATNTIGSEYIISEHALGTNLHVKWPDMTDVQRGRCIIDVYRRLKDLEGLAFPACGSIYFADTGLASKTYTLEDDEEYVVGPHCGSRYWNCGFAKFYSHHGQADQGPWQTMTEYTTAQISTGLAKLPPNTASLSSDPKTHLIYQGSIPEHVSLLGHAQKVLHKMCLDPLITEYSCPLLFHPDLHKRNIFVSDEDPGTVTAIIDWQASAVEPAFWYRWDVPDFAGMKLARPYQVLPGGEEGEQAQAQPQAEAQAQEQKQKQEDEEQQEKQEEEQPHDPDPTPNPLLSKTYTTSTLLTLPTLSAPKYIHENTFRPFILPPTTWDAGLTNLHHELIQLRQEWTGLGFDGDCPFPTPSEQELERHSEAYEMYKSVVEARRTVCEALGVGSDGFVLGGTEGEGGDPLWEERVGFAREYCGVLRRGLEGDEEVQDVEMVLRGIWPFDVDL